MRFGPLAIFITYVIPLPSAVIYATVAATGMSLRRFLLWDGGSALVTRAFFIWLGYQLGQPAVDVVELIAQYSWWISIALLVGIFFNLWRQSRRKVAVCRRARPGCRAGSDRRRGCVFSASIERRRSAGRHRRTGSPPGRAGRSDSTSHRSGRWSPARPW